MKKTFASLVLAGLAAAAFAQTPAPAAPVFTWGGYIDTGLAAQANTDGKTNFGLWGADSGKNGGRYKLLGKIAAGDFGFNFEIRDQGLVNSADSTQGTGTAPNQVGGSNASKNANYPFYFVTAYLYGNFFDKMLYTQLGLIDQRDTRPAGDAAPSFTKEVEGAIVVVKPVEGLSINAFVSPAIYGYIDATSTSARATAISTVTLPGDKTDLSNAVTSFGAAYTMAGTFKAMAQVRLQNPNVYYAQMKSSSGYADFQAYSDAYAVTDAYAGAGLLAVPNLTAWFEYQAALLNGFGLQNGGKQTLTETVSYNLKDVVSAPVSVGLVSYQYLYGSDWKTNNNADSYAVSYRVSPWVSYALDGGITPMLAGTYFAGAEVAQSGSGYNYTYALGNKPTLAKSTAATANLNKIAVYEIKPSVKVALTPTQSLNFSVAYMASAGEDDVLFLSTKTTTAKSVITTQVNYLFTF